MNDEIPKSGVLMSVDYGEVRTGIAFCDYNQEIAFPNGVYGPKKYIVDMLMQLINEREVVGIVVGWPLNMKGEEGFQCVQTQKFIDEMHEKWGGPIEKFDERLSSSYVAYTYGDGEKLDTDDALSAMVILKWFIKKRMHDSGKVSS